ncbi:MAG: DUF2304 family protein [Candidatus Magasanikbacteria bacterium]|nr:DUF2304 family protein [Candidatus Magasanikbacteria bacterium]
MSIIQATLIIFFIFALSRVVMRWRAKELSLGALILWSIFWIIAGIVVVTPNITFYFAHLVGIGRGADLVVYVSLALLFFIVFRLMVVVERQKREITKLTRMIALEARHENTKV